MLLYVVIIRVVFLYIFTHHKFIYPFFYLRTHGVNTPTTSHFKLPTEWLTNSQIFNKRFPWASMDQLWDTTESGVDPLMKLIDISAAKYVNNHTNWYVTAWHQLRSDFCLQMSQLPINCEGTSSSHSSLDLHIALKRCGSVSASSPLFADLLVLLGHFKKSSWTCVHSSKQWIWANWPPGSLLVLEVCS